jgi:hypothetical protein
MLRRIFGPKGEEVVGGWRILYNEELHNLYASSDIIRMIKTMTIRWGACSTHGRDKKCIQNLGWKT